MNKKIIIRKENKEDYRQTEEMTRRAFWNIHEPGCNEHFLVHKLRGSEDYLPGLSRVAELDGRIVGAIFYSKAQVKNNDRTYEVVTFGPLCVDPMYQSLHVGGQLLRETIELAREAGYPGIIIFGEPDYYPHFGFAACDRYGIETADGNSFPAFMALALNEKAFADIKGRFYESGVFAQCEDAGELAAFDAQFPFYPKLKLSCQWLHKERLGRICNVQKNLFTISYWEKELPARCKGNFYYDDKTYPIVGDYVTFDYQPDGISRIVEVCERRSILKRPFPSDHSARNGLEQEMVANVDICFIVCSLNGNFNANRIVRYITAARQGNVTPVVVLTKADLCDDAEHFKEEVRAAAGAVDVCAVSAVTGEGLEQLAPYLTSGTTIAFLGSSGVGKSTLTNALLGEEIMQTGEIRKEDARGRHTTTTRQLLVSANGVVIVDTPGMREIGICDAGEGMEETFADIAELEQCCKFRDCKHRTEPGCAVKAAIAYGTLSEERFRLYLSLKQEGERNFDRKAVSMKRKQIKKYGK